MRSTRRSPAVPASALAIALAAVAPLAFGQEACKSATLKQPAVKLDEMYKTAETHAKAWKSDVVPARITNTILGPLKPDGSSEAWTISFFSPSSNAHVSVNTFRGGLNCWAQAGGAGRLPDLKPGFVIDGADPDCRRREHRQARAGAAPVTRRRSRGRLPRPSNWSYASKQKGCA